MIKKMITWILAGSLSLGLILAAPVTASAAVQTVSIPLSYGQSEARTMLEMINDFRTSETEAWAYDSSGNKQEYKELQQLTYDYELEAVAMKRAEEIAVSFSHTRPNGNDCFTAYTGRNASIGENIAAGQKSARSVFTDWREDNEGYSGQGHRRNMLGRQFRAVGIGHVQYQGVDYWVQEFSSNVSSMSDSGARDGAASAAVEIDDSKIEGIKASMDGISLKEGETKDLSSLKVMLQIDEFWGGYNTYCVTNDSYSVSISDPDIAVYDDSALKGLKEGKTCLSMSAYGQTIEIPVTVTKEGSTAAPIERPEESTPGSNHDYQDSSDRDTGYDPDDDNNWDDEEYEEDEYYEYEEDEDEEQIPSPAQLRASVALTQSSKTLKKGKKCQIHFKNTLEKEYVKKIKYVSSNKKIATVTSKGKVTAKRKGTAVVKCSVYFQDGTSKTVKFKVKIKA